MSTQLPHDDDFGPESYADLAELARSMEDVDFTLDEPPADLWQRIEQRVALESPEPAPTSHDREASGSTALPTPPTPLAPPVDLEVARRRRRWVRPVAAEAAAVAVLGGVTAVLANQDDNGSSELGSVELSNDGLDPRGERSHGTATVVRLDDDSYAIDLDVDQLPADAPGYFELWVIDPNVEGMVSLGPIRQGGRFVLPPGVDPAAFPIVDISIEPVDGVPTHSGDSILRGVIEA